MIKLEIEDYCQDCHAFDPEAVAVHNMAQTGETVVICQRRNHCKRLVQYLERKIRKELENGD